MATQWLRRAWLVGACALGLLTASCGGGDIVSQLDPSRIISFGDAWADAGQNGNAYTINQDSPTNNWTTYVASGFGNQLTPSARGGLSYAIGNARVAAKPDAAGNNATLTVTEQIDAFLQSGNAPGSNDLVIVNAGTSDLIVHAKAAFDGTETSEQAIAAMTVAGQALGAQVRRLVSAGGKHVVVVGPYNMGSSPWSVETGQGSLLKSMSQQFNEQMLVSIVDLGASVLYVDAAYYFNLVTANPGNYDIVNAATPVCTSIDPGPGIGTGANQVNSNLCTAATTVPGVDRTKYLFADRVYPTPRGQQLFGDFALNKIRERW